MPALTGKNVVIVGASRGVGRAIARRTATGGADVLAVAKTQPPLELLAQELPGSQTLALDAESETVPSTIFEAMRPDLLVLSGGAIPPGRPIHELTCEEFTRNWDTGVRLSFLFYREALRLPLPPGTTVIVISSAPNTGGCCKRGRRARYPTSPTITAAAHDFRRRHRTTVTTDDPRSRNQTG